MVIDNSGERVHWQRFGKKLLSMMLRNSRADKNMTKRSFFLIVDRTDFYWASREEPHKTCRTLLETNCRRISDLPWELAFRLMQNALIGIIPTAICPVAICNDSSPQ
ncbi:MULTISPECIES: hypothetical protein [Pseudomonas]|jgi:hypothetical protein|uniref:hypothetical protein n=1 Tax=Pseudomonas TaxID=286 RepID=UPI0015AB0BE9|nr:MULTISPECIES: hypothetical protein [Pseudomonas]QXN53061.1 hypothetical protein KW062_13535 [Pseudomonas fluorescens]WSO27382.1 hypothetical protein VUJ50_13605 [Pseudomonas fluorescens]